MAKRFLQTDVYSEAVARMEQLYREGHRVIVSYSSGKDSTVCLHICREAARKAGRLPIEVCFVDEEVSLPGTHAFAESVLMNDPEIIPHWLISGATVVNIYNRECPMFWPFDVRLEPHQLFRPAPPQARWIAELTWPGVIHPYRFPPAPGKRTIAVTGIRVMESLSRRQALSKSGSYLTKHPTHYGAYYARPIYDWTDGDVWKTILEKKLRYHPIYDLFIKLKIPRSAMRLSSPTASLGQINTLTALAKSCPEWFAGMSRRLPGLRQVLLYGKKAVQPTKFDGETWQQCFDRIMTDPTTPHWVVKQGMGSARVRQDMHSRHSAAPWGEDTPCSQCGQVGSWRTLVQKLYIPWSMGTDCKEYFPSGASFRPAYYNKAGGLKASTWYDQEGLYYTDEEWQHEQDTGSPPTRDLNAKEPKPVKMKKVKKA